MALMALKNTLTSLNLSGNTDLKIDRVGYSVLTSFDKLQILDLSHLWWDCYSVQYLIRFTSEWTTLHPGLETPVIILNMAEECDYDFIP